MKRKNLLDEEYLDNKARGYADRSFLGGLRLATRTRLFFLLGLLAIAGFAAMYVHVDRRVGIALSALTATHRMADLLADVEKELAEIKASERDFLETRDPAAAAANERSLEQAVTALERLMRMPATELVKSHLATVRDELVQYDQSFGVVVEAERTLGFHPDSGLRGRLKVLSADLEATLKAVGLGHLSPRVSAIFDRVREITPPRTAADITAVENQYRELNARIESIQIAEEDKQRLLELTDDHQKDLLTFIRTIVAVGREQERFREVFGKMVPSMDALGAFADTAVFAAPGELERERLRLSGLVAGGSAVIVVTLMFFGLLFLLSASTPVRTLALTAARLAEGERAVVVPVRGNKDASGALARSLDAWLDNLAEIDHLRAELDDTRARLHHALTAERQDLAVEVETDRSDRDEVAAEASLPVAQAGVPPALALALDEAKAEDTEAARGPIGAVSRQLTRYSQYVSVAAEDVERTAGLVRGLTDATLKIDEMAGLVSSIRDQTNLLVFRASGRDTRHDPPPENLVVLQSDGGGQGKADLPEGGLAQRFDAIRKTTDRAESTVHAVRNSIADVTAVAHEIAATASSQALEATSKLLHQSEYLQNMLDDVIAKLKPLPQARSDGEPGFTDIGSNPLLRG